MTSWYNLAALIDNTPILLLTIYCFIEIFDEFKIRSYYKSIDNIHENLEKIRELCTNKNPDTELDEECPIFNHMLNLKHDRRFREKSNYPFLSEMDFLDVFSFALKLKYPKDSDKFSQFLASKGEIRNLLDYNINGLKDAAAAEINLKNRPTNYLREYYTKTRRSLYQFLYGEWYHPIKSSRQEAKAYPYEFVARFKYCLAIQLNKIIYGPCIYSDDLFSGITLSPHVQKQLKLYSDNRKKNSHNFKPVQLNRLLLEEAYPNEIKKGEYTNHLWNIIKSRYILADKQAHFFEVIITQLFILGILSMRDGTHSSLAFLLLILVYIFPVIINENVFDWFKNKNFRFIAALLFLLIFYGVDLTRISDTIQLKDLINMTN